MRNRVRKITNDIEDLEKKMGVTELRKIASDSRDSRRWIEANLRGGEIRREVIKWGNENNKYIFITIK